MLALAGWDGRGVEAAVIAETRDPLLDAQLQAEASVTGSLAAQQTNLQNAGTCLDELIIFSAAPNGLTGLDADLSNLFSSFETLYRDPDNFPLRRGIVRSAQDVAAKFNRASSRLNCLRNDLNASIQKDVVRANQNLNDIAGLNQQIIEARASGEGRHPGRTARTMPGNAVRLRQHHCHGPGRRRCQREHRRRRHGVRGKDA